MEVLAAIIGVISAIVGLLAAIVSKRRVLEHKYIFDNDTKSISWYDNHFWVFMSIVFLYPLSCYALVQSNTISKGWKWFWFIAGLIFFIRMLNEIQ